MTSGLFTDLGHVLRTGEPLPRRDADVTVLIDGLPHHRSVRLSATRHRDHLVVSWDLSVLHQERISDRIQRRGLLGWGEWDLAAGHTKWSHGLRTLLRRPTPTRPLTLGEIARLIDPDDRAAYGTALKELLDQGGSVEGAYRLNLDGGPRYFQFAAEALSEADGTVWGVQALFRDATRSHRTQAQLDEAVRTAEHRQQRAEAEAHIASRLREAVLPSATAQLAAFGLDAAVSYRPAEGRALIGGDWHNVQTLADGRVLLALGDASGHGLDAVARMSKLRNGLAGLAFTHEPVEQLTNWLNRIACDEDPECTATAVIARYHPNRQLLRWVSAGHPPPVLLRAGAAHLLEAGTGLLLGVTPHHSYAAVETPLVSGDTVLLYTDGLVEQRGRDLEYGTAALLRAAERHAHREPQALADAVTTELLPPEPEDDACLLVLRVPVVE
ncbi:PP2C family protein-serine/threonine phosphatase [Streptomyces sp. NPDC058401]|uniref:PP2C family protein-serine/threonine phosphatase n=1 Tax=Streptomyces sp. NPDC058401 TaxID=3346480 RepID=UPI00366A0543